MALYGSHFFEAVQTSGFFPDGKFFVDGVPKNGLTPADIKAKFNATRRDPNFDLKSFVLDNFNFEQKEFTYLPDPNIPIAEHITRMWDHLTLAPVQPTAHSSLLPLQHAHVVPSPRFSEPYYWDSYFTLRGLIADSQRLIREGRIPEAFKLRQLAAGMVQNFADMIDEYGFIPNGARTYYLDRSQPPVFALMVRELGKLAPSAMTTYLPQMMAEHSFWRDGADQLQPGQAHRRAVMLEDGSVLARHWSDIDLIIGNEGDDAGEEKEWDADRHEPSRLREEAFHVDEKTAANSDTDAALALRAAAESGHDFSTQRWSEDGMTLETMRTPDILPVGLNALLYMNERIIAQAAGQAGERGAAGYYRQLARDRKTAMRKHMWDPEAKHFADYLWRERRKSPVRSSDTAFPLFARMASGKQARRVEQAVREDLLVPGGIRTTATETGQQWDNHIWAPVAMVAVEGLDNYRSPLGRLASADSPLAVPLKPIAACLRNGRGRLADIIANRFMRTVQNNYQMDGEIWEKYRSNGQRGGGGEYKVQRGFGWTNSAWAVFAERRREQQLRIPRPFRLPGH
ncbi:alpha,alpha-trehalase [Trinickia sp. LjRoot230]|uniref:trehalase family glycosidase n=1 Tax=Trinickia sp. LjRoot230 TaxID=3342288 RepID=UPI003ECF391D